MDTHLLHVFDRRATETAVRVSAVVALLSLPASHAFAGQSGAPLTFETVQLGTPLAAWRSLKPPGPISPHARRLCSTDPGAAALGPRPAGVPPDAVVCGYVDVYGAADLPVTFSWDQQFPMDHLRYVFRDGALTEVRAQIAVDAFNDLVADFTKAYGAPAQVVRDHLATEIGPLPRVRFVWTPSAGRVEILDPSRPGRLSLRVSAEQAATGKSSKS